MNSKAVIILSLLLNVGLLGAVGYLVNQAPASGDAPAAVDTPANKAGSTGKAVPFAVERKSTSHTVTNTVTKTVDWRSVESEDYKKYIANLRAIGCPEETIRDIIVADVNKLFESRKQALKAGKKKYEFWKAGQGMIPGFDEETVKAQQALTKEKRALLRELLGVEVDEKADVAQAAVNPIEAMLDFLPAGKQTQVMELMTRLQAQAMKVMKGGQPDAEDLKSIQKMKKDYEGDLKNLLSPEEFQDYQLRLSDTAVIMRMQLSAFDPNEQEFRDVFKIRKEFDDQYPMMLAGVLDKDEKAKRDEAQKEVDAEIKKTLGDTRYAEYQRSSDQAYQGMVKLADRQGLDRDAANKFYDVKKVAEDQAKQIRADKSLTDDQRRTALQTIRSEVENQGRTLFGENAFGPYQKNSPWIKAISPDPK